MTHRTHRSISGRLTIVAASAVLLMAACAGTSGYGIAGTAAPSAIPSGSASLTPVLTPGPTATARPAPTSSTAATPRPTPKPAASDSTTPQPTQRPKTTPAPTPKTSPKPTSPPGTGTVAASIVDFVFAPANLTVPQGSTVRWTNADSAAHTVTEDGGAFGSPTLGDGDTFRHTFTTPGTFAYHCAIHPSMTGTVTVSG